MATATADVFHGLADDVSDLRFKNMFGWHCTFFRGNMQAGYHGEQVMLRLPEADRTNFLKLPGAEPFNPKGNRPMKEYVSVPAEVVFSDMFATWFERSLQYVANLPPKVKRHKSRSSKS